MKKEWMSLEQQRITVNQLTSEFRWNQQVKEYESMYSSYRNLESSLSSVTGAGDMSAIFQFMKSLDPNSVVRESEFEMAAKTTGLWDRARMLLQKASNGEMLTPEQRQEFLRLAKSYVEAKWETYQRLYGDMERKFEYFWLPKEIMPTKFGVENSYQNSSTNTIQNPYIDLYNSVMKKLWR